MTTPTWIDHQNDAPPDDLLPDWLSRFEYAAESMFDDEATVRESVDCLLHAVELLKRQASFPEAAKVLERLIRMSPTTPESLDRLIVQAHLALATANETLAPRFPASSEPLPYMLPDPTDRLVQRLADKRVHALFHHSQDVVGIISASGTIEYVSDSIETMLGYKPSQVISEPRVNIDWATPDPIRRAFRHIARGPYGASTTVVVEVPHADGSLRWIESTLTNRIGEPAVNGVVFNCRDITESKSIEQQLERLAYFDSLTSLPNRNRFRHRLEEALARAARNDRVVAVIFIDLDRFKLINDQFGHDEGDIFLRTIGQRLVEALRSGELAARLGGDEFAVLIERTSASGALERAEQVLRALNRPSSENQRFLTIRASAGVAVSNDEIDTSTELLRAADIALYHGKQHGGGVATLFKSGMYDLVFQQATMERDLRQALDHHELHPWLQPEIDLETGLPVSLELLMRWVHPDGTVTDPEALFQTVNQSGLAIPVSLEIIEEACIRLAVVNATRRDDPIRMSVNISHRQMTAPDLADRLREMLDRSHCSPGWFALEIDDQLLTAPDPDIDRLVTAIRGYGIGLVVDGYSGGSASLAQLRRLKPDRLKYRRGSDGVDLCDALDYAMLNAVITVARSLRVPVTIVGDADWARLQHGRKAGCQLAQTSLLCPPTPLESLRPMLDRSVRQTRSITGMLV